MLCNKLQCGPPFCKILEINQFYATFKLAGRFRKTSSSSDSNDYLTEEEEEEVEEDEENVFSGVFSDYDGSSCNEDSEDEDDEDADGVELLTRMIEDFVISCKNRKDRLEKFVV